MKLDLWSGGYDQLKDIRQGYAAIPAIVIEELDNRSVTRTGTRPGELGLHCRHGFVEHRRMGAGCVRAPPPATALVGFLQTLPENTRYITR